MENRGREDRPAKDGWDSKEGTGPYKNPLKTVNTSRNVGHVSNVPTSEASSCKAGHVENVPDGYGSFHFESNEFAHSVFSVKPVLAGSKLCTAMSPKRGKSSAFVPMNSAS